MRQPRSQSISCSPNLAYHNSIFRLLQALCNHNAGLVKSGPQASGGAAERLEFFIASWLGPTARKMPQTKSLFWRPQTKQSSQNFTVTGMSCLDQANTANFGYRKFTAKRHSNPSLMRQVFFLQLQRRDGHDASITQNWWSVLRLSGTSSFW